LGLSPTKVKCLILNEAFFYKEEKLMKEYAYGALKPQTDVRDYKVKAMAAGFPKAYVVPF
jgi:hypothetical protein